MFDPFKWFVQFSVCMPPVKGGSCLSVYLSDPSVRMS